MVNLLLQLQLQSLAPEKEGTNLLLDNSFKENNLLYLYSHIFCLRYGLNYELLLFKLCGTLTSSIARFGDIF